MVRVPETSGGRLDGSLEEARMVIALSTFWTVFALLLVWIPLVLLWVFALVDLFKNRQQFAGWQIALWLLVIAFLPIVGPAAYLIYMGVHSDTMRDSAEFESELADGRSPNPSTVQ